MIILLSTPIWVWHVNMDPYMYSPIPHTVRIFTVCSRTTKHTTVVACHEPMVIDLLSLPVRMPSIYAGACTWGYLCRKDISSLFHHNSG